MSDKYILKGKTAVICRDLVQWRNWLQQNERHVAQDDVNGAHVSTVFLGLDHRFEHGPPLLFETMIFGGPHDQFQDRYTTWEQAETGHNRVVKALREGLNPDGEIA